MEKEHQYTHRESVESAATQGSTLCDYPALFIAVNAIPRNVAWPLDYTRAVPYDGTCIYQHTTKPTAAQLEARSGKRRHVKTSHRLDAGKGHPLSIKTTSCRLGLSGASKAAIGHTGEMHP